MFLLSALCKGLLKFRSFGIFNQIHSFIEQSTIAQVFPVKIFVFMYSIINSAVLTLALASLICFNNI
jgi:hypothetical protein